MRRQRISDVTGTPITRLLLTLQGCPIPQKIRLVSGFLGKVVDFLCGKRFLSNRRFSGPGNILGALAIQNFHPGLQQSS